MNASAGQRPTKKGGQSGVDELFVNSQSMRWLFIDEASGLAVHVAGTLDANLSRALMRQDFAKRADGTARPFGGLNVGLFGDWWQLPPVQAIGFFSNPFGNGLEMLEQRAMSFLWQRDIDSLNALHELVQPMRTTDAWHTHVLSEDRVGAETWETYCFTHGLPTRHCGSWFPGEPLPRCGLAGCKALEQTWSAEIADLEWEDIAKNWHDMWLRHAAQECDVCRIERARRIQVVSEANGNTARVHKPPFAGAPFVHPYNAPKYNAQHLRALEYAKAYGRQIIWVVAFDWPIADGDDALSGTALANARKRWLQLHDKATAGIMGLLPLVCGGPYRYTQSEHAGQGAYKNARCTLVGWRFSDAETRRIAACTEPEIVARERPKSILVRLAIPTATTPKEHGEGCCVMQPKVRVWSRDGKGGAKVRRIGFALTPDFAGTIHAYCGDTLDASIGDLLPWYRRPTKDDMHKAYISKSRTRTADTLLITQPYSPDLFRLGELPGPRILMSFLRGQIDSAEVKRQWDEVESARADLKDEVRQKWPLAMTLPCRVCTDQALERDPASATEVRKPLDAYYRMQREYPRAYEDMWEHVLARGQYLVCDAHKMEVSFECRTQLSDLNQKKYRFCASCGPEQHNGGRWPPRAFQGASALSCGACAVAESPKAGQPVSITCQKCKKDKPFAGPPEGFSPVFFVTWLNGHAKKMELWRCYDCQFPRCNTCFERPVVPPMNQGKWYECPACRQAESAICVKCEDPYKTRAQGRKSGLCDKCNWPPCECGAARPRRTDYSKNERPTWKCNECSAPVCKRCSAKFDAAKKGRESGLCDTCNWPPCKGGCGKPRPCLDVHYSDAQRPNWKCNDCSPTQESTCVGVGCGKVFETGTRGRKSGLCDACNWPPCPGCKAPRPFHNDPYSVGKKKVWWCKACARQQ